MKILLTRNGNGVVSHMLPVLQISSEECASIQEAISHFSLELEVYEVSAVYATSKDVVGELRSSLKEIGLPEELRALRRLHKELEGKEQKKDPIEILNEELCALSSVVNSTLDKAVAFTRKHYGVEKRETMPVSNNGTWPRTLDAIIERVGMAIDQLQGRAPNAKGSTTKKLRKALGYTYP